MRVNSIDEIDCRGAPCAISKSSPSKAPNMMNRLDEGRDELRASFRESEKSGFLGYHEYV